MPTPEEIAAAEAARLATGTVDGVVAEPVVEKTAAEVKAEYEAKLAEVSERNRVLEESFEALHRDEATVQSGGAASGMPFAQAPSTEQIAWAAKEMGVEVAEAEKWLRFTAPMMAVLAGPYITAQGALFDRTDLALSRSKYGQDFLAVEDEVEKVYLARLKAGKPTTREELYHVIRARKPEGIDDRALADAGRSARTADRADTRRAVAAALAEDTTIASARVEAARSKVLTREEFAALPLDKKEAALENVSF